MNVSIIINMELPLEMIYAILSYSKPHELYNYMTVNSDWCQLCKKIINKHLLKYAHLNERTQIAFTESDNKNGYCVKLGSNIVFKKFIRNEFPFINKTIEDGWDIEWYENGNLSCMAKWNNGELIGVYKEWYKNGQISLETNYDDIEHTHKEWYENGILFVKVSKKGNKLNGKYERWHKNGRQQLIGWFSRDKPCGIFKYWNKNGDLVFEVDYRNYINKKLRRITCMIPDYNWFLMPHIPYFSNDASIWFQSQQKKRTISI